VKFDRRQQPLFIDARKLGTLVDRVHRERAHSRIADPRKGGLSEVGHRDRIG
jgi:hypothetical protein